MSQAVIEKTKDNKYVVCTQDGVFLAGPFDTSEDAVLRSGLIIRDGSVLEMSNIGSSPVGELGALSIVDAKLIGGEGYYVCIDNLPYIPVTAREDAECIVRSYELGLVALVHKRFLGGLGDLIVFSGAAVAMSKIHDKVVLTSTSKYKTEFDLIFADYPQITLDVVLSREGVFLKDDIPENLLFHDESLAWVNTPLDEFERTYKHFGIPYRHRWDSCPIESACGKVEQVSVPSGDYIFIHEDAERERLIDRKRLPDLPIYNPAHELSDTILSFKDVLENATEVHVMDSAFFHLAECLKPKGKLFYHRYARMYNKRYNDYKTRYKWKVLI